MNVISAMLKDDISPQRSQSPEIPARWYEKAPLSRRGTQITRIARIFTDPCASASSAQSVFYCFPSGFVSVHPRLFFCTDELLGENNL